MKLSKKFLEDLHKIGEWSFIEKNMWVGKLVPEIIIDNLQKRGINQGDLEGVVCLSVEEAEKLMKLLDLCEYWLTNNQVSYDCDAWASLLEERIAQAEMSKQST